MSHIYSEFGIASFQMGTESTLTVKQKQIFEQLSPLMHSTFQQVSSCDSCLFDLVDFFTACVTRKN